MDQRDAETLSAGGDSLDDLAAECVALYEQGGDTAVDAFCELHPAHASEIRQRMATLRDLGLLDIARAETAFPERFGDFRLLEQLGGGGMGVVYRAEQMSLGRTVALKLVRPDRLFFEGARERFRREIETVAQLQHPGIVPVYGAGVAGDLPYFAMELVRGCSLDEVIVGCARQPRPTARDLYAAVCEASGVELAETPELFAGSWEESALRIARAIGEALQHAHDRGVVHRDVKPSNVMITPEGRVMLVDFGLASSTTSRQLTHSGAVLGSPHYMAPEQARGESDSLGPPVDVYALGVTLYELLTRRRAFTGGTTARVLTAIERGDVRPPRIHDPTLSWEAQTICLTAMDIEPDRRYPTAGAMAADLAAALAHRPISARPASRARRLRRWCQRHPARAVGAALGSFVLVVGPTTFAIQQLVANRRIGTEARIADANLVTALRAVDAMLTRVGASELRHVPQLTPVRQQLLQDATTLFAELEGRGRAGDDVARGACGAQLKLAMLQSELGNYDDAEAAFDRLQPTMERLATSEKQADVLRLADLMHQRGILARHRSRLEDAERAQQRADALLATLPTSAEAVTAARIKVGAERAHIATLRGDVAAAEATLDDAAQHGATAAAWTEQPAVAAALARVWNRRGDLMLDRERYPEAIDAYERGAAIIRALLAATPDSRDLRTLLASQLHNLAIAAREAGDPETALEHIRQSHAERRQLVREFPAGPDYRYELAKISIVLANTLRDSGDLDGMHAHYSEAALIAEELAAVYPGNPNYIATRGFARQGLGFVAAMRGDFATAADALQGSADDLAETAGRHGPDSVQHRGRAMSFYGLMLALKDLRAPNANERGAAAADAAIAHGLARWPDFELAVSLLRRAAAAAMDDESLTPSDRTARRNDYTARAAAALRAAADAGHHDAVLRALDDASFSAAPYRALKSELEGR